VQKFKISCYDEGNSMTKKDTPLTPCPNPDYNIWHDEKGWTNSHGFPYRVEIIIKKGNNPILRRLAYSVDFVKANSKMTTKEAIAYLNGLDGGIV
jgi:hypothetical protein